MRYRFRNTLPDVVFGLLLFLLPLMVFAPQTLGGRTLLPADNLYQFMPFAAYREVVSAPSVPQNALVSDMVLQNLHWKTFIRESLFAGEVPLWNPHQFAGVPFMAAGQPSTLYPLNALYLFLPMEAAYGWFVVVNLWLCGLTAYMFLRGLRLRRAPALLGAVVYQLNSFFVASAVFPMMLGGAAWLPLLLLMTEYIIRGRPAFGRPAVVPWVVIGAAALGLNLTAGHVEITYYTILITAYYGLFRLIAALMAALRKRTGAPPARPYPFFAAKLGWLAAMGVLGMALGAAQFVPLFELVNTNWRAQGKSFAETLSFAHPVRDVLMFAMPNFYGSPAQHRVFDVFTWERVAINFTNPDGFVKTNTEWGIKNYIEGAMYVGILPLVLAAYALLDAWLPGVRRRRSALDDPGINPPYRALFAILAGVALLFMFGTPLYALVYYGLPGLNQSHTPFRWVYAFVLSISVLAAYGLERLTEMSDIRLKRVFAWGLTAATVAVFGGAAAGIFAYDAIAPGVERVFAGLALADRAFPDARLFFSHVIVNLAGLGMQLLMAAAAFWLLMTAVHYVRRRNKFTVMQDVHGGRRPWWMRFYPSVMDVGLMTAVMAVALDLMMATSGFNPAADPALLRFKPPVVEWLQAQPGDWRYTTLDDPSQPPILPANVTWRYGLDDIRGYESIIPRPYVDYMRSIYPQVQLDFNRIAPLYTTYANVPGFADFDYREALTNPRFHLLNVRYVVTHLTTDISDVDGYTLAYEDEAVRVWENANAAPRAFVVAGASSAAGEPPARPYDTVEILSDTGRELLLGVPAREQPGVVVVSQSHFEGWRAYLQTPDGEQALPVVRVLDNFTGVALDAAPSPPGPLSHEGRGGDAPPLPDGTQAPPATIRLVYSPTSFQVGFFGSAVGGLLALFLLGVWAWRRFVIANDTEDRALLARNSIAPVILNLFNRGIDFVFAFVMLRILGPADTGIYYYAVVVFVWFDIFTNFGLDTFTMREVSRDRSRARQIFVNTTAFRLLLSLVGVLLLIGFIAGRQTLVAELFDMRGIIAILLLYVGLVPSSLSKGMTSLYYAFERAEYPAAVATVTTVSKAVLGLIVLLAGFGIIGLAGVSIINNFVTLAILMLAGRDMLAGAQTTRPQRGQIGHMARESYPLMLNHFLATIFFQIDVVILEAMRGAAIVGKYSVGYRWLLALNIIPAFFTMAIFPRLSRQAEENRDLLRRNYVLSLKLLAALVFPAAVLLTFLAEPLTLLLGGNAFLPEGAIALQIMVWSMPLGWMNSLTQYVLIALNRQRQLTWAFAVGVAFNIITNVIFIPIYGYRAAAVTTILSEAILMVGFAVLLRGDLRGVNWFAVLGRPALAAGAMSAAVVGGWMLHPVVGLLAGVIVYPAAWLMLRPLRREEWDVLAPLLPARVQTFTSLARRPSVGT